MYWEEWLTELISEFRKKSSMLPRNQKQQISNLDNLEFPCQVDVLWVKNERLGSHYQVLFITHFEDEPDMSFNLYETSEPYRFHEISTKMLESPKWQKRLPKTEANRFIGKMYGYQTYQDYMVGALSNQYTMMKQYFNHLSLGNPVESKARTTGKQALFNELGSSVWEVRSDLTTTDPKEVADDIFKSLKPRHKNNKLPQKKATKVNPEKQLQGYGALLLPRIWIGKLPEQSLKDRIEMNLVIAKTVFNKNYKQSVVVLRQDGFIGVVFKSEIPENRAISISIELLNEIIATCMITNLPFHTIREPDLVKIRCEPETLNISGMSWRSNDYIYPLLQQQDVWGSIQPSAIYYERRIIRRTAIPKAVSLAERLTTNQVTKSSLLFLLEAHSLYTNFEYSQSFLSSWIIIENHIRGLWDEFIKSRQSVKARENKLFNPNYSDVDHIIETLNLSDRLSAEEYTLYMRLKKTRNDIVHKGIKISQKEAGDCFELAFDITRRQCEI